jgi:hypothetical protein
MTRNAKRAEERAHEEDEHSESFGEQVRNIFKPQTN